MDEKQVNALEDTINKYTKNEKNTEKVSRKKMKKTQEGEARRDNFRTIRILVGKDNGKDIWGEFPNLATGTRDSEYQPE